MQGEQIFILINPHDQQPRQRFTIFHELGHYLLGHLGETPLSRSEKECRPVEEQAADRFAIDMLAPACVLWAMGLKTPEEIAKVCQISMQAAEIRAKRLKLLGERGAFLTHPLEKKVFIQFYEFIENYRKNS